MSLLHIDSSNELQFQTQDLVGRSIAILGITGSGKTNTTAVLIEELLSNGFPLTIIDIEGEYWGLKEKFEILVAGRSQHSELEIGPENAAQLAEISIQRGISVILDLSDFTQNEAYDLLLQYFTSLWTAGSLSKQPYQIVLEEAHEFVPQGTGTPLKQILARIALRGRKRGLGIVLVSQRSAKVEKDLLTQTSLLFLHKVVHPIDLKIYKDLIPLPGSQVEDMIRKLEPGEAIVIYNHHIDVKRIRLRDTFHAGSTPTYTPLVQPKLRKLDEAVLKELKALISTHQANLPRDERSKLAQQVKELQETLALKDAEIQRLQDQIELLSKLQISIGDLPSRLDVSNTQTLEINRAIVRQVIAGEKHGGIVSSTIVAPESEKWIASSPRIVLTSPEERKLDSLIRRMQKLPKLQRLLLKLLTEHMGTSMTIPTIATWLSLQESTIRSRPPHDLIRMKLITRTRERRGYNYMSSITAYVRAEFPQIEPDFIVNRLLESLQ
jgi:hypothetical protein